MSADLIERLQNAHDPLRRTNLYREAAAALAAKDTALSEMRAELERARKALADIERETMRCRGDQSYRDAVKFVAKTVRTVRALASQDEGEER